MKKPKCIIVDLEGTLTNCNHRIKYWLNKDYDKWNELFSADTINENMVDIIKDKLEEGYSLVMSTAKSISKKDEVLSWLRRHNLQIWFSDIFYRLYGDDRPSPEIKSDILKKIREKYSVEIAYDDREDICEMYVSQGVHHVVRINQNPAEPEFPIGTPADILREAASTFESKNEEYGDGWKKFGAIMMSLFPTGLELKTEEDFSRFAILNIMVAKLDRYCKNFNKGGHPDSLIDLSVYSAMLLTLDKEGSNDSN